MKLPALDEPLRYRGLFVFDFGEWTALGYTAEEVAMLLESEQFRSGKVYKIARVSPDGAMELRGVATERFHLESGLFHWRSDLALARRDFDDLCQLAETDPPPSRGLIHLVRAAWPAPDSPKTDSPARFVTALVYPAEYDEEFGRWLLDHDYAGGDWVEGGISLVSSFHELEKTTLDRRQIWSQAGLSRTSEEVFRSVRMALQR